MDLDFLPLVLLVVGTIALVMGSIEIGYRLGRRAHRRSPEEKESAVSAIEGSVLALLAFILAFTFQLASDRFNDRRLLVREEANAIRKVWLQSDFLAEPSRGQTKALVRDYVHARATTSQSADHERVDEVIAQARQIQARLWRIAVEHAAQDMGSDISALYLESLNDAYSLHASRVALGLQSRIPLGIWATLGALTFLGMCLVGYHAGVADSKRTMAMTILALAFSTVIVLIHSLDRPVGGFTLTLVSQQPMLDLLADIDSRRTGAAGGERNWR